MSEAETVVATLEHIREVRLLLKRAAIDLLDRAETHDRSKLSPAELPVFVEFTPRLKGATYGSEEYKGFLREMKPALDNHYAQNRHHPEHFEKGVNGMNLLDVLEMVLDWKAATLRHDNGDLRKSIEINRKRFGLSDQMVEILLNTADWLEDR